MPHATAQALNSRESEDTTCLPPEILDLIVHFIDDRATLKSTSLSNRLFGALTRALLLRRLRLDCATACSEFLASCAHSNHGSLVKELVLSLQPTKQDHNSVIMPPESLIPVIPLLRNVQHLELTGDWDRAYQSKGTGADNSIAAVDVLFGTDGLANVRTFVARSLVTHGLCVLLRRMPHLEELILFNVTGEVSSSVTEGRMQDAVKLRSLRFGEEWAIEWMMRGARVHWSPFCLEHLRELHLDAPPFTDENVIKDVLEYLNDHLEVLTLTGPLRECTLPTGWDEKDNEATSATQRFKYRGLRLCSLTLRVDKSKSIVQWVTQYIHRVRSPWAIADLQMVVLVTSTDEWDIGGTWSDFDDALGTLDGGPPKAIHACMSAGGALTVPQSEQGEHGIQDVEEKSRIALKRVRDGISEGMGTARNCSRRSRHRSRIRVVFHVIDEAPY